MTTKCKNAVCKRISYNNTLILSKKYFIRYQGIASENVTVYCFNLIPDTKIV